MVKKLLSFEFRIFRHFVTIFRNLVILRMSYLRNKMRFSKTFFAFTFFFEYSYKKKIANLSWQKMKLSYFLLPVLWRHFRAKTRQHQKIQKHTTVWNRKFYYHAKIQLKRLTIENLVERDDFLMTADPPCSVSSAWAFSREFKQDASLAS